MMMARIARILSLNKYRNIFVGIAIKPLNLLSNRRNGYTLFPAFLIRK